VGWDVDRAEVDQRDGIVAQQIIREQLSILRNFVFERRPVGEATNQ